MSPRAAVCHHSQESAGRSVCRGCFRASRSDILVYPAGSGHPSVRPAAGSLRPPFAARPSSVRGRRPAISGRLPGFCGVAEIGYPFQNRRLRLVLVEQPMAQAPKRRETIAGDAEEPFQERREDALRHESGTTTGGCVTHPNTACVAARRCKNASNRRIAPTAATSTDNPLRHASLHRGHSCFERKSATVNDCATAWCRARGQRCTRHPRGKLPARATRSSRRAPSWPALGLSERPPVATMTVCRRVDLGPTVANEPPHHLAHRRCRRLRRLTPAPAPRRASPSGAPP